MKDIDSKYEANKLFKEYIETQKKIKDLEKSRIIAFRRAKTILIILTILFAIFLFIIATSFGTFSKSFHVVEKVQPSTAIQEKGHICSKVCMEEGGVYNAKKSETNICECINIGFFKAFSKKISTIDRHTFFVIDNYSSDDFTIMPTDYVKDCEYYFINPTGYAGEILYWDNNYIIRTICPSLREYSFVKLSRNDLNINEPPKIIVSTRINGAEARYNKYYSKLVTKNEKVNIFFNSSRSFDPDGTIKNITFNLSFNDNQTSHSGEYLDINLSGEKTGTYVISIKAIDDKGITSTDQISIILLLWEINQERTLYLVFGGVISFILTMIGIYYFNRFLSYYRRQVKILKAFRYFVKSVFFGVMLNIVCIMFTIRATFLPTELSRTLQDSVFIPNTNIENPATAIIIKISLLIGFLIISFIILRKLDISIKSAYEYIKMKIKEHLFITIISTMIIIFLLVSYIRLKF